MVKSRCPGILKFKKEHLLRSAGQNAMSKINLPSQYQGASEILTCRPAVVLTVGAVVEI
jgi:hypothetical protein